MGSFLELNLDSLTSFVSAEHIARSKSKKITKRRKMTKLPHVTRGCLLVLMLGNFGAIVPCIYADKHYTGITAELQNRRVCGEVSSFVNENKI